MNVIARTWLSVAALLLLGTSDGRAQQAIATDRPGMSFSTLTVPRGAVQLEIGLPAFSTISLDGVETRQLDLPGLVRVGVSERVEIRLGSYLHRSRRVYAGGPGTLTTGFAPEATMQDLIYLGLTLLFFALCWGFLRLAERL